MLEQRVAPSSSPRARLITIDGLFRQYDHHIPLRMEERVTVLHGRNGVGKTLSLSLVAALLRGDYATLAKVPFDRLRIDFTEESFLSLTRAERGKGGAKRIRAKRPPVDGGEWAQFSIEYKIGDGPVRSGLLRRDLQDSLFPEEDLEPAALRDFCRQYHVHFVEAQRLFRIARGDGSSGTRASSSITTAMTDIAAEMAARVQSADSMYRSTSTRLDDSLPARLFAPPGNGSPLSKKELVRRTAALEAERRRLHGIGLLPDTTSFNPSALNDTQRAMFVVYLKDNEEKLGVFRDLADRAEILLGILNRKLAPKTIKLDKDRGYEVKSHDGRVLDLDLLSSGEQHEMVLLHNLLFRVEPNALLLIDEPELSLHVTWQSEFLDELIQIAKKVGFDVVVATHSPYIVGERRELMVQLGEPM